jgi:glycosyltransferase involved in cell wall biosynthesis
VLFVGHGRAPDRTTRRKWDALSEFLQIRIIVESAALSMCGDNRIVPLKPMALESLRGAGFYARLPIVVRRQLRCFRPDVIVTQSPYDAIPALLARWSAGGKSVPLVVEVHGDWRSATRLYGSRWRRLLSPLGDAAAVWALRRASAIRAIGPSMSTMAERAAGKAPLAVFPTFHDAETYFGTPCVPLPVTPTALWVGRLERAKNPELLAAAWTFVAEAVPNARLIIVGAGRLESVMSRLKDEYPDRVRVYDRLAPVDLLVLFDSATTLVLPSRSEGLGRVIIEAFARGRPVIATRVGGITDLVQHEVNGLLVPSSDTTALAEALIRLLKDKALATRLGERARANVEAYQWTADRYARAMRDLVHDTLAKSRGATANE